MNSIEDYEWKQVEDTSYEKTVVNMRKDLLYIEENEDGKYEVNHSQNMYPPSHEDETLHTATTWEEADAYLEAERHGLTK